MFLRKFYADTRSQGDSLLALLPVELFQEVRYFKNTCD